MIAGKPVPNLSPEDTLIMLCVQVAKDCWEGRILLAKLCDIAELLRNTEGLDWRWVMDESGRLSCRRSICFGLRITDHVLGAAVPQTFWDNVPSSPAVEAHATYFANNLFLDGGRRKPDLVRRVRFHFDMQHRWRDKLAQLRIIGDKRAANS